MAKRAVWTSRWALSALLASLARCTCRDVCKPPYEDAIEECEWRYDPSRDWVGNRDCKAYAKRSYEACLDACRYPDFSGDGEDDDPRWACATLRDRTEPR